MVAREEITVPQESQGLLICGFIALGVMIAAIMTGSLWVDHLATFGAYLSAL